MNGCRAGIAISMLMAFGLFAACAPSGSGSRSGPTDEAVDVSGTFDIGDGRRMFLECTGSGSPTVILVGGQRASAEDWAIVAEDVDSPSVYALVGADTRVCAYDRPGTPVGEAPSRSDPVDQPTTAADMVSDLRALVGAAGIEEPFVIVGHSAGGLAARLYAATYPDDVSGMVLVDALGEGLRDHMTAEQWAIQKPMLRGDIGASIAEYPALEWIEPDASFDQMRAAGGLKRMPLIVISADQPIGPTIPALKAAGVLGQEVPDDFGYVTDAAQVKSQADLAASVPGSIHVTETNSGHNVHIEQPALVAGAILDVVRLVRDGIDVATG